MNNELNKDIIEVQNSLNRMTEDYKSEKQNREQLEQDTVRLEKKLDEEKDIAMEMEKILLAQQLYNTGDLLGSADQIYLLNDGLIDTHPIYSFTLEFRQDLAKELYEIGKKAYFIRNEENYKKAVQYFEISRKLASDGEYAHNALYLMGIAKYKLGNNEEALADFKYYVDNYPEGDNHTDAAWYITQIE